MPHAATFDDVYEQADRLEDVYDQIVDRLVNDGTLSVIERQKIEAMIERRTIRCPIDGVVSKLLKEEMAGLGPVRLRDVDEAQASLIATAKDLAAKGEIDISRGEENEELVY